MRVAALTTFAEACGIATYSEALTAALRELGVHVDVFAPLLRSSDEARGEPPQRLWSRERARLGEAWRVFQALRRARADVVHLQVNHGLVSPRFVAALSLMCRAAGLPLVATMHGRTGGKRSRRLAFKALELALTGSALVVHNDAHARELGGGAHVIRHGIGALERHDLGEAKRALCLDPATRTLAHFGFLHPDKGIEAVIRALATPEARAAGELVYLVVGGTFADPVSRSYPERLRALARTLGVDSQVRVFGEFLPDAKVTATLAAADWIVLNYASGAHQGTSGAARVAVTSGRPIAVSRAPIFDDLRAAALTLDTLDGHALQALFAEPHLSADATRRAAKYCEASSWRAVAREHMDLYERALARRRG